MQKYGFPSAVYQQRCAQILYSFLYHLRESLLPPFSPLHQSQFLPSKPSLSLS